jgi:hypothetical protein
MLSVSRSPARARYAVLTEADRLHCLFIVTPGTVGSGRVNPASGAAPARGRSRPVLAMLSNPGALTEALAHQQDGAPGDPDPSAVTR